MKCWAKNISQCSDTQSREHYITKGLFIGKMLKIKGFPFLNGEIKEISKASLTKKCLCVKHNSLLSPFDNESIKFGQALKKAIEIFSINQNSDSKNNSFHHTIIDAELFIRWVLKTYIGMLSFFKYDSAICVDEIAKSIFSSIPLKNNTEFKIVMNIGDNFQIREEVVIAPLEQNNKSKGLFIEIYGIELHAIFHKEQQEKVKLPKITFDNKQGISYIIEIK